MEEIRVGIVGTGGIAAVHADALASIPGVRVAAVMSRREANANMFAEWKGVPQSFTDLGKFLAADLDVVSVCYPNSLHCETAIAAARSGRHVIVEKPLAMSLGEADAMIHACRDAGKLLFYAEELPFIPKFRRVKELVDEGAIGEVYMVRQSEKHGGPGNEWFYQRETAGGGALMDMGCHGIELIRFILGGRDVTGVAAQMDTFVHTDCALEDHALVTMRFTGGAIGVSESSWALKGGMESVLEVYGTKGVIRADLFEGAGVKEFSEEGYGMMADSVKGWSHAIYDIVREHGYIGEMEHFIGCVRSGETPIEGGAEGRKVLEIMLAAYASAKAGRTIALPFEPANVKAPVDLWKPPV